MFELTDEQLHKVRTALFMAEYDHAKDLRRVIKENYAEKNSEIFRKILADTQEALRIIDAEPQYDEDGNPLADHVEEENA